MGDPTIVGRGGSTSVQCGTPDVALSLPQLIFLSKVGTLLVCLQSLQTYILHSAANNVMTCVERKREILQ